MVSFIGDGPPPLTFMAVGFTTEATGHRTGGGRCGRIRAHRFVQDHFPSLLDGGALAVLDLLEEFVGRRRRVGPGARWSRIFCIVRFPRVLRPPTDSRPRSMACRTGMKAEYSG